MKLNPQKFKQQIWNVSATIESSHLHMITQTPSQLSLEASKTSNFKWSLQLDHYIYRRLMILEEGTEKRFVLVHYEISSSFCCTLDKQCPCFDGNPRGLLRIKTVIRAIASTICIYICTVDSGFVLPCHGKCCCWNSHRPDIIIKHRVNI